MLCQVFKATLKEDFKDIVRLLPEDTPLRKTEKIVYLIARLELRPATSIQERLALVNEQGAPVAEAVGPAIGFLMATFGTNLISSCIFDFDDPEDIKQFAVDKRLELWGLQVPIPYYDTMIPAPADSHFFVHQPCLQNGCTLLQGKHRAPRYMPQCAEQPQVWP